MLLPANSSPSKPVRPLVVSLSFELKYKRSPGNVNMGFIHPDTILSQRWLRGICINNYAPRFPLPPGEEKPLQHAAASRIKDQIPLRSLAPALSHWSQYRPKKPLAARRFRSAHVAAMRQSAA